MNEHPSTRPPAPAAAETAHADAPDQPIPYRLSDAYRLIALATAEKDVERGG